jgi:hypothetical protein
VARVTQPASCGAASQLRKTEKCTTACLGSTSQCVSETDTSAVNSTASTQVTGSLHPGMGLERTIVVQRSLVALYHLVKKLNSESGCQRCAPSIQCAADKNSPCSVTAETSNGQLLPRVVNRAALVVSACLVHACMLSQRPSMLSCVALHFSAALLAGCGTHMTEACHSRGTRS